MSVEIERKFLIRDDSWHPSLRSMPIRQAYLAISDANTIRVRLSDQAAWLTIKGKSFDGARPEFEYPIPLPEAEQLAVLSPYPIIEKTRHFVEFAGMTWEIDVFAGENHGLVVAEVELERIDQAIDLPDWVSTEVTGDFRYHNAHLCRHPYSTWPHT